jgi:hypothetical protein
VSNRTHLPAPARPAPRFRRGGAVVAGLLLWAGVVAGCHGPAQDHSRFESAVLLRDHTVLFSFKHLVYRPAEGLAAFPDGGVPKYDRDEDLLGTYHIPSGALRILRHGPNRRWTDGQGSYGIQRSRGNVALVSQGGQLRRDLAKSTFEDWLLDIDTGAFTPVDYRTELAERQLASNGMYLVDTRGTLLFVTRPLHADGNKSGERDAALWIRTPAGEYLQVAQTSHYEGLEGSELIFWIPETRRFKAFDLVTRTTRDLPGYRVRPQEDPVEGIIVDTGGQQLLFGRKAGAGWHYEPLSLPPARLKGL